MNNTLTRLSRKIIPSFQHQTGNACVESLKVPEAAVAYSEKFLVNLAQEKGFGNARVIAGSSHTDWQTVLLAYKTQPASIAALA